MTVSSETNRVSYSTNASTTVFSVTFGFDLSTDLLVTYRATGGSESTLTKDTNYTVTGGNGSTGSITTIGGSSPYAAGTLVITRQVPRTQLTDYTTIETFPLETIEDGFDKLTYIVQEYDEIIDRTLKTSLTNTSAYDANDKRIENLADAVSDDDAVNKSFMETYVTSTLAGSGGIATENEAIAGTNNTKAMTPLRTADAIEGYEYEVGAGTNAASNSERFSRRLNLVDDFGADPTGVADSYAAFAAALASYAPNILLTAGVEFYVPAGKYKISQKIDMSGKHGVYFVGAGVGATEIFSTGNYQVFYHLGTGAAPLLLAGIKNMTIRGGGKANALAHGIDWTFNNNCEISNVYFLSCRNCLTLNHQWQTKLSHCSSQGAGTDQSYNGLYMGETNLTYIDNCVIASNLIFQGMQNCGFRIINGQGSKFINCEAGGTMVNAWYIGDPTTGTVLCQWIHFDNCLGDSTSGAVWLVRGGSATEISQLQFSNCWAGNGSDGFYFDGAKNIPTSNNQSIGNTNSGVSLVNCEAMLINGWSLKQNNEAASATNADIIIQGGYYNIVSGCHCNSNAAGKSLIEKSGTDSNHIYGNIFYQGVTIIGANTRIFRNQGFKTEARGTATLNAGITSLTVNHGLGVTPAYGEIVGSPRSLCGGHAITSITSTQFTVQVASNAGGMYFDWQAQCIRQ